MFIDEVKIYVKAGDGGRGCVSLAHYKHNPKGGPDGGDGGRGGDVIFESSAGLRTLIDFMYHPHNLAGRGGHGSGNNRCGKDGEDLVLRVPMGTVVKDVDTGEVLADLTEEGQRPIAAKGGRGGRGNARFKSPTRQVPRTAEAGGKGEERWLLLELKLMAEVGLVGLPNAGKSTLLSRISSARPKIADYPFTTLVPTLGVVRVEEGDSFVAADIPGLIKDGHRGKGLGIKFLRHVERTELLVHLVDMSQEGAPLARYREINEELKAFSEALSEKEQVVAASKTDLPDTEGRLDALREELIHQGIEVYPISSVTGSGIKELIHAIMARLKALRAASGAP